MTEIQIIDIIIFSLLIFPATKLIFVVLGKPLNAYVWGENIKWEKKVELPRIFLTILFVTIIFVMRHECKHAIEITSPIYKWAYWVIILSIFFVGALLNLVYTNRFDQIIKKKEEESKVFFNLNKPEKDYKRVFNSICKYFIDKHQIFEYSLNELEDLIKPNNKGMVFKISEDQNKKFYFFVFFKICKEVCFILNNTDIVAKERFLIDNKPLSDPAKAQSKILQKLSKREMRELKENLKRYQINWEPKELANFNNSPIKNTSTTNYIPTHKLED